MAITRYMGVESSGQLILGQKHGGAFGSVSHCRGDSPFLSLHLPWNLTSYSGRGLEAISISSALGTLTAMSKGKMRVGLRSSEWGEWF